MVPTICATSRWNGRALDQPQDDLEGYLAMAPVPEVGQYFVLFMRFCFSLTIKRHSRSFVIFAGNTAVTRSQRSSNNIL
jgi:hypothetical protein